MENDIHDDLENPLDKIDRIISDLDKKHEKLTKSAVEIGHAKDALQFIRPLFASLSNTQTNDPLFAQFYLSTMESLSAVDTQISNLYENDANYLHNLHLAAGTITSFVMTSGSSAAINEDLISFDFKGSTVTDHNWITLEENKDLANRLKAFDNDLGNTYLEVWEALYGTRADPERVALFAIRQVFDHFFSKLAPDDEVRNSIYWKQKKGDKPDQITRLERIIFAVNKHIKNEDHKKSLIASSKTMLDVYRGLNRAHNRKELNVFKAKKSLEAMRAFIELWANYLDI